MSSKARLVITAIEVEGRSPAEVCATYGVSRSWRLRHPSPGRQRHHIGIGRTHTGTHVPLLIQDLHIRVIDAATGELLRELVLDPTRDHQPTGRPPGPTPR